MNDGLPLLLFGVSGIGIAGVVAVAVMGIWPLAAIIYKIKSHTHIRVVSNR